MAVSAALNAKIGIGTNEKERLHNAGRTDAVMREGIIDPSKPKRTYDAKMMEFLREDTGFRDDLTEIPQPYASQADKLRDARNDHELGLALYGLPVTFEAPSHVSGNITAETGKELANELGGAISEISGKALKNGEKMVVTMLQLMALAGRTVAQDMGQMNGLAQEVKPSQPAGTPHEKPGSPLTIRGELQASQQELIRQVTGIEIAKPASSQAEKRRDTDKERAKQSAKVKVERARQGRALAEQQAIEGQIITAARGDAEAAEKIVRQGNTSETRKLGWSDAAYADRIFRERQHRLKAGLSDNSRAAKPQDNEALRMRDANSGRRNDFVATGG